MKNHKKIYVIIPCFNEKVIIRQTVLSILQKNYQVILVDDSSDQDIQKEINDLPIFYLRHFMNLGQGAALQTGMDFALKKGAEIVIHFDADGQHNPNEIKNLIQPIIADECDIVLGSRFLENTSIKMVPHSKRIILKLACYFNGLFTGLWLTDAHNGFRVLNKNALQKIQMTEPRMAHATEILTLIKKNNLRWKEVPVHITYSAYSKEKGQSIWNAFNIIFDLLKKRLL